MAHNRPGENPAKTDTGSRIRPADLAQRRPHQFTLTPDAEHCARIAEHLDLIDLRKARLEGKLTPVGARDWDLDARLGATVVQPCVATLAPVTTRIEEPVARHYRTHMPDEITASEIEMPEDDALEPLPDAIDLYEVFTEAVALALPQYPRAPTAELEQSTFTEPGKAPMTDDDVRPFATLAGLKRKLEGGPDDGDAQE